MATTVQARLDDKAQTALEELIRDNGWTRSQAIRECILITRQNHLSKRVPRLVGIGCVDFGPGDLSTNKKYLRDLGVKSMGKGWRRPKARAK